ncbi:MAG: hypothetical protein EBZ83_04065, partial [Verrucomicrobia bacterium]|nr:hypothetical protein [Verrucomicrobiota bacterium]NDC00577.1 hypothetical protein [Verrucomicrobiota bacterium]NDF17372.1 hypothetical protein [Verrucomicrobiota bacterium]
MEKKDREGSPITDPGPARSFPGSSADPEQTACPEGPLQISQASGPGKITEDPVAGGAALAFPVRAGSFLPNDPSLIPGSPAPNGL